MNTLENQIREMNKEILNLKTGHLVVSSMITYHGWFNFVESEESQTVIYEITYVEGNQPIITFTGYADGIQGELTFGEPDGNKQLMYDFEGWHTAPYNRFELLSTRQILSIRRVG